MSSCAKAFFTFHDRLICKIFCACVASAHLVATKAYSNDLKYWTGNQTKSNFAEMRMSDLAWSKICAFKLYWKVKKKQNKNITSKKAHIYETQSPLAPKLCFTYHALTSPNTMSPCAKAFFYYHDMPILKWIWLRLRSTASSTNSTRSHVPNVDMTEVRASFMTACGFSIPKPRSATTPRLNQVYSVVPVASLSWFRRNARD